MTQYQGNVQSYVLEIQSPNSPYDQKAVISLHGAVLMSAFDPKRTSAVHCGNGPDAGFTL